MYGNVGRTAESFYSGKYVLCVVISLCAVYFVLQQHHGCAPRQEVWVFGMVDTSQSPALEVMTIDLLQHCGLLYNST